MSVGYNAALVRYRDGHVYVDRSGLDRPRELYIEMGGVASRDAALAIAAQILTQYRGVRHTDAVQGQVRTQFQVPGLGYQLGDNLGGELLRSYTVSLEGDGLVTVTPQFDDPVQVRLDALARQIERAGAGTRSEYGRPVINRPSGSDQTDSAPPTFSQSDVVTATYSPAWRAQRPWHCAWLDAELATPGSVPTKVAVARGVGSTWVIVQTATIPAGLFRGLSVVNRGWAAGERLVVGVVSSGGGAKDLTITLRGVMV